jgi:hypothetical protein
MTYTPKKGFLLDKRVKRMTPKSSFLKKLECEQAKLAHPDVKALEREEAIEMGFPNKVAHPNALKRKLTLIRSYKERRK